MRVYKNITPKEAKAAGYQSFEAVRRGKAKDAAGMDANSEQFAALMGGRIVGYWDDDVDGTTYRRTFWYVPA